MRALIIVDMLNDFVDGKLANPKAQAIVDPLQRLQDPAPHLEHDRQHRVGGRLCFRFAIGNHVRLSRRGYRL